MADVHRFLARPEQQTAAATAKETHKVLRTALSAACREELIATSLVTLIDALLVEPSRLDPWSIAGRSATTCSPRERGGRSSCATSTAPSRVLRFEQDGSLVALEGLQDGQ